MNGYVLNNSPMWAHVLKRSVGPGAKIPLDELYNQYGKKHGLESGEEFIEWLKTVKLKDKVRWKLVVTEDVVTVEFDEQEKPQSARNKSISVTDYEESSNRKTITMSDDVDPKNLAVGDITSLSVRKAREVLPRISDSKILKYALQEASTLANRDSLCKLLRKRISELEVSVRM